MRIEEKEPGLGNENWLLRIVKNVDLRPFEDISVGQISVGGHFGNFYSAVDKPGKSFEMSSNGNLAYRNVLKSALVKIFYNPQ